MRRTVIVDGYNIAHAWRETKRLLGSAPLEEVRRLLVVRLAEYAAVTDVHVEVVFDGPRRRPGAGVPEAPAEVVDGVVVRFSGRSGSADALIERLVYSAGRGAGAGSVLVATSDRLQRDMVRAMGAQTIDAPTLEAEVRAAAAEVESATRRLDVASRHGRAGRVEGRLPEDVYRRLDALRRGIDALPPEAMTPADVDRLPQGEADAR